MLSCVDCLRLLHLGFPPSFQMSCCVVTTGHKRCGDSGKGSRRKTSHNGYGMVRKGSSFVSSRLLCAVSLRYEKRFRNDCESDVG